MLACASLAMGPELTTPYLYKLCEVPAWQHLR